MKHSTSSPFVWLTVLAAACLLLPRAAHSQTPSSPVARLPSAPPDPVVALSFTQASSFQVAFTALAREGHVAFVAEDQPLKMTLLPRLVPHLNPSGELLPQMVSEVAAAYDYEAERHGNVFLLKKRFTEAADLPDVTLAECGKALADLQQITNAVSSHLDFAQFGSDEGVASLLTSLTPAQLEVMRNKALSLPAIDGTAAADDEIQAYSKQEDALALQSQGLPISTLTPDQRDVIRQILLVVLVNLPTLALNSSSIVDIAKQDPSFCWHLDGKQCSFGYEISDDPARKEATKQYTSLIVTGGSLFRMTVNGKPAELSPDATKPLLRPQALPPAEGISLAQAVSALDASDPATAPVGAELALPKRLVEAALAPKRVSLFGEENTPPAALFQALADIYGLSVYERSDHRLVLTRHPIQIPADYTGFAADVKNSLPEPLMRAVTQKMAHVEADREARLDQISQGNRDLVAESEPLTTYALRSLRTAAEPRIAAAKDGHVLLSSLGDRENTALAVFLSAPQVEGLVKLADEGIPQSVTRFDELCLIGGPEVENKRKFDLALALPVAGGTAPPWQVISISGIDYTPSSTGVSIEIP